MRSSNASLQCFSPMLPTLGYAPFLNSSPSPCFPPFQTLASLSTLKQEECSHGKEQKDLFHLLSSPLPSSPSLPSHKGAASIPLLHKKDLPNGLGQERVKLRQALAPTQLIHIKLMDFSAVIFVVVICIFSLSFCEIFSSSLLHWYACRN